MSSVEAARVALEVLAGHELRRVHEDAGDHEVAPLARRADERQVTVVKRSHGGHESDGLAFSARRRDRRAHLVLARHQLDHAISPSIGRFERVIRTFRALDDGVYLGDDLGSHVGRLLVAGKRPGSDVLGVGGDRLGDGRAKIRVALRVLGQEVPQAEQVVEDLHLAVAAAARTDTDGGDREQRTDALREFGGDALEHDRERAGLFERERVGDRQRGARGVLALRAVAAEGVDRLRREADVPHHGNAGVGEPRDELERGRGGVLDLDGVRPALGDEASGVAHALGVVGGVGHERHVGDDERPGAGARDTAAVARTMSSIVTGSVDACPSTVMPRESPTSTTSTPAASTSRAPW